MQLPYPRHRKTQNTYIHNQRKRTHRLKEGVLILHAMTWFFRLIVMRNRPTLENVCGERRYGPGDNKDNKS